MSLGVPIYFKQLSCRTEGMHGTVAWRTQHLHWSWWNLFGNSYIPISYQDLMLLPTNKVERNFLFLAVAPIRFLVSLWHLISCASFMSWPRDPRAIENHKCTWASVLGKSGKVELEPCRLPQTWQPPLHTERWTESKTILSFKGSVKFPDRNTFLFFKDTAALCGRSPFSRLSCRRWRQYPLEQISIWNRA